MTHNISLPRHRYIHVLSEYILQTYTTPTVPAVWYGVSVEPGRSMGCHVLTESGAMVIDLPLHALRHDASGGDVPWTLRDASTWDGFGWAGELWEPPYLSGLSCRILSTEHKMTSRTGILWFCLDHLGDGFSLEPAQHKHLWVVAETNGCFAQVPQDQLLITDSSFTEDTGIPAIIRQTTRYVTERLEAQDSPYRDPDIPRG